MPLPISSSIFAHSASVKVLATSREGLGLADEQVWPVPSLDFGAGTESAAVTLFVERARSVAPHFSVSDEPGAVVEICSRLDGIALAIELAASRIASMTAGDVRDRLDHRFRLLVGSRRGLARHQTLRHAVAWSYDQLNDAEKALLERCSVFAGGFDLQSACAIAGFEDADDYTILDLLDALVRKSLLVVTVPPGGHDIRCWKPSANSPRNSSLQAAQPAKHARHMPATSPGAKKMSSPCGTVLSNVKPM
jgi:predicted ATPase